MVDAVMRSLKEALSIFDINGDDDHIEQKSRRLLHTFLNTNPYGIVALNNLGTIKLTNKMTESLFGFSPDAMIDKPLWMLSPDVHQKTAVKQVLENIFKNKPKPVPYFGSITNQQNQKLHLRVDWDYLISADDKIIGLLAIVRDVSQERVNQKYNSPSLIEQVQYSRLASVEEVVGRIAHELNQPLSAIMNFSHGALRQLENSGNDQIASAIQMISKQAQRAGDVLQRIRDFIQKGEMRKEFLNINDIIHEVLDCMRQEIRAAKVDLHITLDNFLPAVLADKIQIEQVLLNIIQNAIESMYDNPIDQRNLTITSKLTADNKLSLSIADNGHGIPEKDIDAIFDAFHSTKSSGMGIGLAISQSIIQAHHGDLMVSSTEGKGSTFTIYLPPQ